MDAAYTPSKRTGLYLVTALLLTAPLSAVAQVTPSATTIALDNSCQEHQTVQVTSTGGAGVVYTATPSYSAGNQYGNWLYTSIDQSTAPPSSGGTASNLTIGLNFIPSVAATASVLVKVSGTTVSTITVNYVPGNSCSGASGSLTATPDPMSFTATVGQAAQSQQLTLQNTSAQGVTVSSINSDSNWLSVTATGFVISANSSTPITVYADATYLTNGTYNGHLTVQPEALSIPVTFTVGTGGGGGSGGGTGTLTLNGSGSTANLSFSYVAGSGLNGLPNAQVVSIRSSSANAASLTYGATVTTVPTGGTWLVVDNETPPVVSYPINGNGGYVYVGLPNSVTSLAVGTYTGTIAITASDGSTATINVTLAVTNGTATGVTVLPDTNHFFTSVAAGSTLSQSQSFQVSAPSGVTLASVGIISQSPSGSSPFSLSNVSVTASQITFTATANPTNLGANTYTATIAVLSTSTAGTQQTTITLTLVVGTGSGGGNTTGVVVPTTLNFAYQTGTSVYSNVTTAQTVEALGPSGGQYSAVQNQNWITFPFGASGPTPGALRVNINPNGLTNPNQPGNYGGTVTVTLPDGSQTPVTVNMLVTTSPVIVAGPGTAVFNYLSGGTLPAQQTVNLIGSDGSTPVLTAASATSWLTATVSGNNLILSVNPSNLAAGAYSGSVTVNATGYANSPMSYPVILVVASSSTTGPLTLSTSAMTFTGVVNSTPPLTQTLTVSSSTSVSFTATSAQQTCNTVAWLSISPSGALYTNQNILVSASQAGLQVGTCNGIISLTSNGSTQNVPVTLIVTTSGGGNTVLTSDTASLSFAYQVGGAIPNQQGVHITSAAGSGTVSFSIATSVQGNVANWLQSSFTTAATPVNLGFNVNPAGLAAGTYQGQVTLTPTSGAVLTIPVTLTVTSAATVSATPSTLTFSYTLGGSAPAAQAIQVTGGSASLPFSATATSTGSWLSVSPTSGTTGANPISLSVTVDPTKVTSAQTYTGTIVVAGTGSATGSTTVTVTLTVTAPLPTITKVTSAATFLAGAVSPGEIISIFADPSGTHPIGPATGVGTQLDANGKVATTLGGVQVKFLPFGVYAPLTYVSATQINCVVPYEVAGFPNFQVQVVYFSQGSNAFSLTGVSTSPGIFTANGSGTGPAALRGYDAAGNDTGYNAPTNPTPRGGTVVAYITGEGQTSPAGVTGKVTPATLPTPQPLLPLAILIDGQPANWSFYGEAPGFVSGVMQVNIPIPLTARTGDLSLAISVGGNASQTGVTVSVK